MAETIPPPIYSQQDPQDTASTVTANKASEPQILLIPTVDAVNFQNGYLGADGERAAIEGELQAKGIDPSRWNKVIISLRTIERAYQHKIELSFNEIELYSSHSSSAEFPCSFPFAIPLMPDTPQSMQTPVSSLSHILTAKLLPVDSTVEPVTKSLTVHTRRYTSHLLPLVASPETHALDEPTRIEVQVPRTTFTAGEPILLYITVPPPKRELVVTEGIRLRNVQAELVRDVTVRQDGVEETESAFDEDTTLDEAEIDPNGPSSGTSSSFEVIAEPSTSKGPLSPLPLEPSYTAVIARSGASCRFHSSRPIQLRFVLRQPLQSGSPSASHVDLPGGEYVRSDIDAESALITQSTLLHTVAFQIKVHVSFVDISTRTERISTLAIPVTILPPPAPLPEVSHAVDEAYSKKHDRPPAKTIRHEDVDPTIPHYSEGEAGPSMLSAGAPPPFEERDAPPPFFTSAAEASTSSRLPSFLEAEREIILPHSDIGDLSHSANLSPPVAGEGVEFGFRSSQQFDGYSEDMQRSCTPPPTLEMASRDTNLTALTDIEPGDAVEALGIVLDQREEDAGGDERPPPPPAMDDPSDPPPSIDSDFRSPVAAGHRSPPRASPPLHASYHPDPPSRLHISSPATPSVADQTSHGHAPPPYLVPESHRDEEQVTRPPPYVD